MGSGALAVMFHDVSIASRRRIPGDLRGPWMPSELESAGGLRWPSAGSGVRGRGWRLEAQASKI
eukprot:4352228-Pyramimonas_sp.AAC.1